MAWWSDAVGYPSTGTRDWLLVAAPHSQTTWSILGNTGVGLVIIAACLFATDRSARLRRLAAPVIAVGSRLPDRLRQPHHRHQDPGHRRPADLRSLPALACLAAAGVLAVAWTRAFRRGPLEYMLHAAAAAACWIHQAVVQDPLQDTNSIADSAAPRFPKVSNHPASRRARKEVSRCRSA